MFGRWLDRDTIQAWKNKVEELYTDLQKLQTTRALLWLSAGTYIDASKCNSLNLTCYIRLGVHNINGQSRVPRLCSSLNPEVNLGFHQTILLKDGINTKLDLECLVR